MGSCSSFVIILPPEAPWPASAPSGIFSGRPLPPHLEPPDTYPDGIQSILPGLVVKALPTSVLAGCIFHCPSNGPCAPLRPCLFLPAPCTSRGSPPGTCLLLDTQGCFLMAASRTLVIFCIPDSIKCSLDLALHADFMLHLCSVLSLCIHPQVPLPGTVRAHL